MSKLKTMSINQFFTILGYVSCALILIGVTVLWYFKAVIKPVAMEQAENEPLYPKFVTDNQSYDLAVILTGVHKSKTEKQLLHYAKCIYAYHVKYQDTDYDKFLEEMYQKAESRIGIPNY
jgi:hypothetical protein